MQMLSFKLQNYLYQVIVKKDCENIAVFWQGEYMTLWGKKKQQFSLIYSYI